MSLRFHEIAEGDKRILNPISAGKLDVVGQVCTLDETSRVLDLACGKGEMLVQWAVQHGIRGVGVDISEVFINAAKDRAYRMDVGDRTHFVQADAANYPEDHHEFDVVACIGATWIGGGLSGTLALMRRALPQQGGMLVVGEAFWRETPPPEAQIALDIAPDTFASLPDTLARFEQAGLELIDMVLANRDEWDRYEASQWSSVAQYLTENADDPEAEALWQWVDRNRRAYLTYGRRYMDWGIFVLRPDTVYRERQVAGATSQHQPRADDAVALDMDADMLWMTLRDGRVIGNPRAWFPWLMSADASLLEVSLTPDGARWPTVGQFVSVAQMLKGQPSSGR